MPSLRINAIYPAIEGEGIFVGLPQIFVRLQGCRVGCRNCDSKDTWSFKAGTVYSISEVLSMIDQSLPFTVGQKRVAITGGDPTDAEHLDGVIVLVKKLKVAGHYVTLEASGDKLSHQLFDLLDYINFDFKTPSTNVVTSVEHLTTLLRHYQGRYQIKSVVEDKKDFEYCVKYYKALMESTQNQIKIQWIITPAYSPGEEFPRARVQDIYRWNFEQGSPFRIIMQQHKVIFGPNQKNI